MSDSETPDPRPRPAYGEYATPEEQRARIQQPDLEAVLDGTIDETATMAAAMGATDATPSARASLEPVRPMDRVFTLALLGFGAVNVFFSVQSFLDMSDAFTRTFASMGIPGEFTNTDAAQTWGTIAAVVMIAGFLITAIAAWRRLRAGRISWWIPLVGAAITYVIVFVCLAVPLWGDPAFQAYIASMS